VHFSTIKCRARRGDEALLHKIEPSHNKNYEFTANTREHKWVLSFVLNSPRVGDALTLSGREFQVLAAATEKARSPQLALRERGMSNVGVATEQLRRPSRPGMCFFRRCTKYAGAVPHSDRKTMVESLKVTLSRIGSQWSRFKRGRALSRLLPPQISRAAAFWTACRQSSNFSGKPEKREFA
jgi:hypothetical protein